MAIFQAGCWGALLVAMVGSALVGLPWPEPAQDLAFDAGALRATAGGVATEFPYDQEALAVVCEPPPNFVVERAVDLRQAIASGHGPTIAEAIRDAGRRGFLANHRRIWRQGDVYSADRDARDPARRPGWQAAATIRLV